MNRLLCLSRFIVFLFVVGAQLYPASSSTQRANPIATTLRKIGALPLTDNDGDFIDDTTDLKTFAAHIQRNGIPSSINVRGLRRIFAAQPRMMSPQESARMLATELKRIGMDLRTQTQRVITDNANLRQFARGFQEISGSLDSFVWDGRSFLAVDIYESVHDMAAPSPLRGGRELTSPPSSSSPGSSSSSPSTSVMTRNDEVTSLIRSNERHIYDIDNRLNRGITVTGAVVWDVIDDAQRFFVTHRDEIAQQLGATSMDAIRSAESLVRQLSVNTYLIGFLMQFGDPGYAVTLFLTRFARLKNLTMTFDHTRLFNPLNDQHESLILASLRSTRDRMPRPITSPTPPSSRTSLLHEADRLWAAEQRTFYDDVQEAAERSFRVSEYRNNPAAHNAYLLMHCRFNVRGYQGLNISRRARFAVERIIEGRSVADAERLAEEHYGGSSSSSPSSSTAPAETQTRTLAREIMNFFQNSDNVSAIYDRENGIDRCFENNALWETYQNHIVRPRQVHQWSTAPVLNYDSSPVVAIAQKILQTLQRANPAVWQTISRLENKSERLRRLVEAIVLEVAYGLVVGFDALIEQSLLHLNNILHILSRSSATCSEAFIQEFAPNSLSQQRTGVRLDALNDIYLWLNEVDHYSRIRNPEYSLQLPVLSRYPLSIHDSGRSAISAPSTSVAPSIAGTVYFDRRDGQGETEALGLSKGECPVCFEGIQNGQGIIVCSANHVWCANCHAAMSPQICPICRTPVVARTQAIVK